jgi:hypothetical protein
MTPLLTTHDLAAAEALTLARATILVLLGAVLVAAVAGVLF